MFLAAANSFPIALIVRTSCQLFFLSPGVALESTEIVILRDDVGSIWQEMVCAGRQTRICVGLWWSFERVWARSSNS